MTTVRATGHTHNATYADGDGNVVMVTSDSTGTLNAFGDNIKSSFDELKKISDTGCDNPNSPSIYDSGEELCAPFEDEDVVPIGRNLRSTNNKGTQKNSGSTTSIKDLLRRSARDTESKESNKQKTQEMGDMDTTLRIYTCGPQNQHSVTVTQPAAIAAGRATCNIPSPSAAEVGEILGFVFGPILVIAACVGAGICFWRRCRRQPRLGISNPGNEQPSNQSGNRTINRTIPNYGSTSIN